MQHSLSIELDWETPDRQGLSDDMVFAEAITTRAQQRELEEFLLELPENDGDWEFLDRLIDFDVEH